MPAKHHSFHGRRLLQAWGVAAVLYALTAAVLSVGPIRQVIHEGAAESARAAPSASVRGAGVVKIVGRQAAIVVGPPLLLLWFGWDVWFVIVGFFGRDRDTPEEP